MNANGFGFQASGNQYQQVQQYRLEMDQRVIADQIQRRGTAIVIRLRDERGLNQIHDLPALGDATPWYGSVGSGYRYTVHSAADGWSLRVENVASGFSFLCAESLPVLEVSLKEIPAGDDTAWEKVDILGRRVASTFQEDEQAQTITLRISGDILQRLAEWISWGEAMGRYEFIFNPSSVGELVGVRHVGSGESVDLTKAVNW